MWDMSVSESVMLPACPEPMAKDVAFDDPAKERLFPPAVVILERISISPFVLNVRFFALAILNGPFIYMVPVLLFTFKFETAE